MIDFERRKEKNIFNPIIQNEESNLTTEQSKNLYNTTIKNENYIKLIGKEINKLKSQICDIFNIINDQRIENDENNINKKENNYNLNINGIKKEIYDYINKEIKIQLKENIKLLLNEYFNDNSNKNDERNKTMHLLNQKKHSMKFNKTNKTEFNEQLINPNINKNIPSIESRNDISNNLTNNVNEDDINERKNTINQEDLTRMKNEISKNFEKVNLKILNELKNQAYDIKALYLEIQNFNIRNLKNEFNTISNDNTSETIENKKENIISNNNSTNNFDIKKISDLIYLIQTDLSKKVDLEQLNYALNQQEKLNEVLTSSCKICRLCWNSEDTLINNKYIKWSMQSINTALDVFLWKNNSEKIEILQKGVYKIIVGLIGLEKDKEIIIICNNSSFGDKTEKIFIKSDNSINKFKYNYNNENVKFLEKYMAFIENTEIKIEIFDKNNNIDYSEEAFLELKKII